MIDKKIIEEGLKRGKVQILKSEIEYLRVKDGYRGIERGTVIVGDGRAVWSYPHIKRVFTLEKGLEKNMGKEIVHVEEKIDGFNVRIISDNGKIYAFSRGGFLDLFVTEKAREMGFEEFFSRYPDYTVCGEMIGNTPYTQPAKDFDVVLYVFDIAKDDGSYLSCEERYSIVKKYGMLGVPVLGEFKSDDFSALKKIFLKLNKEKKEGMVIKSEDRLKAIKYVTPYSDIEDISRDSYLFFDMPMGFFYQRVFRSAFVIDDFKLDSEEYSKSLGQAFYDGVIKSIDKAKSGKAIDQNFVIFIKDEKIWDDIRKHMSKEVRIEKISRKKMKGGIRIDFKKTYKKTTKLLLSYSNGKGVAD